MSTNKHIFVNRSLTPEGEIAEFGPFTWKRRLPTSENRDEAWELTHISGVKRHDMEVIGLTFFAVKNYGGTPGKGFAGWKLVSGGPFDAAGSYDNVNAAIEGVTPYVIEHFTRIAATKQREAKRILSLIADFQPKLTLAMPAGAGKSDWSPCG